MLTKPAIVTVIPGTPGQAYEPPSQVCVPLPPRGEGGTTPPTPAPGSVVYVYVPNNPNNRYAGEVRTPMSTSPAGYTCQAGLFFDIVIGGLVTPVYEVRCYWNYP